MKRVNVLSQTDFDVTKLNLWLPSDQVLSCDLLLYSCI